jgi:hypothetical protein
MRVSIYHQVNDLLSDVNTDDESYAILDLSDGAELGPCFNGCGITMMDLITKSHQGEGNHSIWQRQFNFPYVIIVSTDPMESCNLHNLFINDAVYRSTTCADRLESFVKWLNRPTYILVSRVPTELTKAVLKLMN